MALKTRGIVVEAAKEITYNVAPSDSSYNVVVAQEFTLNPKENFTDRKQINCSIVKVAGIDIESTTEGTATMEIVPDTSGTDTDFFGAVLYEAGLGYKYVPGHAGDSTDNGKGGFVGKDHAGSIADEVSLADNSTAGTDIVYTLQPKSGEVEERKSIAVRKFYDASNVCLDATGIVINKVDINTPTADIATITFGMEGADYTTPTDKTKPTCGSVDPLPFIGKSATFKYDGNMLNAMDVSFSVANTITNEKAITGNGVTDKIIVEKQVTGTFKLLLQDMSLLQAVKEANAHTLYLNIKSGSNELGIYFPQLKLTEFSITDNSNMLIECTVNFTAETKKDLNPVPQAMLVGVK
jgi:hypothetical protein